MSYSFAYLLLGPATNKDSSYTLRSLRFSFINMNNVELRRIAFEYCVMLSIRLQSYPNFSASRFCNLLKLSSRRRALNSANAK